MARARDGGAECDGVYALEKMEAKHEKQMKLLEAKYAQLVRSFRVVHSALLRPPTVSVPERREDAVEFGRREERSEEAVVLAGGAGEEVLGGGL